MILCREIKDCKKEERMRKYGRKQRRGKELVG